MSIPKVFIIILQYNNSQDTIRCLASVKELNYQNYSIIIVDNASSLHHLNSVRLFIENEERFLLTTPALPTATLKLRRASNYQLLVASHNLGYSGGNNIGIKNALKHGADYVFILNPDAAIIEKNALTKLIDAGESNSENGIIGSAINEGGRMTYGGKIEWLRPELRHLPSLATSYQLPATSYYLSGAAILIKREVIKKIGLFDERYFLYFEDADYCVRAQKAGYKLIIVPETRAMHAGSASTSSLGAPLLLRYHFRNAHLFNWKNGPWHIKLALPFWSIFIIIKQLIKIVFMPSRREISKVVLSGVSDFYRGRFGQIK